MGLLPFFLIFAVDELQSVEVSDFLRVFVVSLCLSVQLEDLLEGGGEDSCGEVLLLDINQLLKLLDVLEFIFTHVD